MYDVKWLKVIARDGLDDLIPAIRQAFNADPTDDRLDQVYGESPRARIIALAVIAIIAGELFARIGPDFGFKGEINWPAVAVGASYAYLIRRYLFGPAKITVTDFPWLAASLVPAVVMLMLLTVTTVFFSTVVDGEPTSFWAVLGALLVAATDAIGVAAALTIAVATLCFGRKWVRALWDLALRLFVFKLMVWITTLVLLEIGIVGHIVSAIFNAILGWQIPEWIPEFFDQIGYAVLLSIIYLAVIGATWTICRSSFAELLETGHVNVLDAIVELTKDPEKKRKKEEKKAEKERKKQEKAQRAKN